MTHHHTLAAHPRPLHDRLMLTSTFYLMMNPFPFPFPSCCWWFWCECVLDSKITPFQQNNHTQHRHTRKRDPSPTPDAVCHHTNSPLNDLCMAGGCSALHCIAVVLWSVEKRREKQILVGNEGHRKEGNNDKGRGEGNTHNRSGHRLRVLLIGIRQLVGAPN